MKGLRFTDDEIMKILKEVESGEKVHAICQKYGISDATFYKWKAKYVKQSVSGKRQIKQLETESSRLKTIDAIFYMYFHW